MPGGRLVTAEAEGAPEILGLVDGAPRGDPERVGDVGQVLEALLHAVWASGGRRRARAGEGKAVDDDRGFPSDPVVIDVDGGGERARGRAGRCAALGERRARAQHRERDRRPQSDPHPASSPAPPKPPPAAPERRSGGLLSFRPFLPGAAHDLGGYERVATPRTCGEVGRLTATSGNRNFSKRAIANPASSIASAVSRPA